MIRRLAPILAALAPWLLLATPAGATDDTHAPRVQMTVVDHTHGHWHGLATAVAGWNRSPVVHLTVADHCAPGVYCVTLHASRAGATGWLGLTGSHGHDQARIALNTSYGVHHVLQAAVLCHELGHALGVAHPTTADQQHLRVGCIAGTIPGDDFHTQATDDDLAALARVVRNGHGHQSFGALCSHQ